VRLGRLRFSVQLLHEPLKPKSLLADFSQPPSNLGTPPLRSLHFQHESLFFHFKHGQLEEGAGGSSGAATVHQSGHRLNMLHATLLKRHGFPLSLPLSQDFDCAGKSAVLLFGAPPQSERAWARAGSTLQ